RLGPPRRGRGRGEGSAARPARSRHPEAAGHRRGAQRPGWPGPDPPAAPEGARDAREPLMHADRTNRTALIVFGSLVLLAGAAGMLTSVGVFSNAFSKHALFANQVSTYIGKNGAWVWPAAAAVGLLIALPPLRWILALVFSPARAGGTHLP